MEDTFSVPKPILNCPLTLDIAKYLSEVVNNRLESYVIKDCDELLIGLKNECKKTDNIE